MVGWAEGKNKRRDRHLGLRRYVPTAIFQPAEKSERERATEDPGRQDTLRASGHSGLDPILPFPEVQRDVRRDIHRAGGKVCLKPRLASVVSQRPEGRRKQEQDTGSWDLSELLPQLPPEMSEEVR